MIIAHNKMDIAFCLTRVVLCTLLVFVLMMYITGCKNVDINKDKVYSRTDSIEGSADKIKDHANETLGTKLEDKAKVLQNEIITESQSIKSEVVPLRRDLFALSEILESRIETLESDNKKLSEKNSELITQLDNVHKSILYKVLGGAILLIIASIPLFIYVNQKAAISVGIIGLVTAGLSVFLIKYLSVIATIIGITLIVLFIGLIIYLLKYRKGIKEVVTSFEYQKDKLWNEDVKNAVSFIQSDSTKEIVKNVKNETQKV